LGKKRAFEIVARFKLLDFLAEIVRAAAEGLGTGFVPS
jgi:hypothetical protein